MERHSSNAMVVAEFLEKHPKVKAVIYPGLKSHPQHELAKRQNLRGFSGMVSFHVKTSDPSAASIFVSALKQITSATSLGGTESLVSIPSLSSHVNHPPEVKKRLGIDDSLVRLSVGLEDVKDLLQDLQQALEKCS
jgi:cystathionine beta-lyase/cystathionine gamma-synthase